MMTQARALGTQCTGTTDCACWKCLSDIGAERPEALEPEEQAELSAAGSTPVEWAQAAREYREQRLNNERTPRSLLKAADGCAPGERLRPLDLHELFALEVKPREMVLDPIIPEKGLAMLYAARGTGKTHVALGIAYAVATGSRFLRWCAPRARRVLLVDGEMPAVALKDRLRGIAADAMPQPSMFGVISGDLIEQGGVGNLASPAVQCELDPHLEGVELLILDNLSSLTTLIRDNEPDSWNAIQTWLLKLRRLGISVLIIHHAGKGGDQRGTSRREDVLDTSISLRRPTDYVPTQGARFEVHIEKGRGIHGEAAKPFEARLIEAGGRPEWIVGEIEDINRVRIAALLADGLSVRDIADEIGIPKSTVGRIKKAIGTEASSVQ